MVLAIARIITASVTVFIPPAVELGEPPIDIRIIVKNLAAGDISATLIVLKPAVLAVIALNMLSNSAVAVELFWFGSCSR